MSERNSLVSYTYSQCFVLNLNNNQKNLGTYFLHSDLLAIVTFHFILRLIKWEVKEWQRGFTLFSMIFKT